MKRSTYLAILPFTALSIAPVLAGCTAGAEPTDEISMPDPEGAGIGREHRMLTEQARALREAAAGRPQASARSGSGLLHYYGGPLIQAVNVVPVYWTSAVQYQANLNAFYAAAVTGSYIGFFSQYATRTPAQTIGNGTLGTPFIDDDTSTNVTDAQIHAELNRLFANGSIPAPSSNNLYMVHFPPGVSVTDSSGDKSCVVFCAYHGTYVYNRQDVFYGVIPDQGGGCAGGCGGNAEEVNNLTSVTSHEFAESLTDPGVGLATFLSPPLAWYNLFEGEIGDICNAQQGQAVLSDNNTYTVQKLWSNSAGACVVP